MILVTGLAIPAISVLWWLSYKFPGFKSKSLSLITGWKLTVFPDWTCLKGLICIFNKDTAHEEVKSRLGNEVSWTCRILTQWMGFFVGVAGMAESAWRNGCHCPAKRIARCVRYSGGLRGVTCMVRHCTRIDGRLSHAGYLVSQDISKGTMPRGHWHHGIEILMVHSGLVKFQVDNFDRIISRGDVLIIRGDKPHLAWPFQESYFRTVVHFTSDNISKQDASGLLARIKEGGGTLNLQLDSKDRVRRCFWAISELLQLQKSYLEPSSTCSVKHLLGLILAETASTNTRNCTSRDLALLADIMAYMESSLADPLLVSQVAKLFFVSESHMRALFQSHLGKSPQQYMTELRMEKAKEYLSASTMTVSEVADLLGFGSRSGFQRAFRRQVGVAPTEFRKNSN